MGMALEWEPWNWDLWNTPLEPDDDEVSLELNRQMLEEALQVGREGEKMLAEKLHEPNP
ncbi:MAG: hypothetical protein ABIF09_05950 [Gemmatimonadota bacterium]